MGFLLPLPMVGPWNSQCKGRIADTHEGVDGLICQGSTIGKKQDLINTSGGGGSVCRRNGLSRSAVLTGSTCVFLLPFSVPSEPLLKVSRNPLQKKVHEPCHMTMTKPRRVQ